MKLQQVDRQIDKNLFRQSSQHSEKHKQEKVKRQQVNNKKKEESTCQISSVENYITYGWLIVFVISSTDLTQDLPLEWNYQKNLSQFTVVYCFQILVQGTMNTGQSTVFFISKRKAKSPYGHVCCLVTMLSDAVRVSQINIRKANLLLTT